MSCTELEQTNILTQCEKAEAEPGRDAKPPCPSTDPPSISGQGMDFQREREWHASLQKVELRMLGAHPLCLFPPVVE